MYQPAKLNIGYVLGGSPVGGRIKALSTQQQIVAIMEAAQQSKAQAKALLGGIDAYVLEQLGINLPAHKEEKKCFVVRSEEVKKENRLDPFYYK